MMTKAILVIGLEVFLYFNSSFIIDVLFEDVLKNNLKVLEGDINKVQHDRSIILHLMPLCILLSKTLTLFIGGVLIYLYFKPAIYFRNEMIKQQAQLHYEFPIWIRSIQCHLQSSNVVVSIEKSYETAPILLKYHLKDLIWKLSTDPHNLSHYEGFMKQYENYEIEKMMKFLYRFNTMDTFQGDKHLDRMIESTGLWMQDSRMKKQDERLNKYAIFGILPVVLVSIYFLIMMTMVIMGMMEGGWML